VFAILVRDPLSRDPVRNDFRTVSEIYEMLFNDNDLFAQTIRFYTMCVMMHPEERSRTITSGMAKEFADARKIEFPLPSLFTFAFFDLDGTLLEVEEFDHTEPAQWKGRLLEMMGRY